MTIYFVVTTGFSILNCFVSTLKAYKLGMFGAKYVWILLGYMERDWWLVKDPTISCSSAEILQAMDGHLATDYLWTTAPDTKTVYGKVSRSKTSARPDQMLLVADQNV